MDGPETEIPGSKGILLKIIDKEGFLFKHVSQVQDLPEARGQGFAIADEMGVKTLLEERFQVITVLFFKALQEIRDMDGVGIAEEEKAVTARQLAQERDFFRRDGIHHGAPGRIDAGVTRFWIADDFPDTGAELLCGGFSCLKTGKKRIPDGLPVVKVPAVVPYRFKCPDRGREVEVNQYPSQVKNDVSDTVEQIILHGYKMMDKEKLF